MADGAERGYDVDTILRRRRGGRRPVGSAAASVKSVRLDPELKRALMIRSGVDARPVVLALVEDTIGSLASLLLARRYRCSPAGSSPCRPHQLSASVVGRDGGHAGPGRHAGRGGSCRCRPVPGKGRRRAGHGAQVEWSRECACLTAPAGTAATVLAFIPNGRHRRAFDCRPLAPVCCRSSLVSVPSLLAGQVAGRARAVSMWQREERASNCQIRAAAVT